MAEEQETVKVEPITKRVTVALTPQAAFNRFTEGIGSWWPKETHSVGQGEVENVILENGKGARLYEQRKDGSTCEWGIITVWEPPHRVGFTWHPGREPDTAQEVAVSFTPTDGGTEIEVVHSGWEILGEEAEKTRADYDNGWDVVLARYTSHRDAL
ncbi:MAG: SRPBCC domain-containing protein [Gemmatimonadales bacterium]